MTTAVPQPTFGPAGFIVPQPGAILAGVVSDWQSAFNNALNLSASVSSTLSTPQGQLASSLAAIINDVDETFLFYTTQTDPAFAEGRMQDAIGRIYFIERNPSQPTVLQILCTGGVNTVIPVQALIEDAVGVQYGCDNGGTIPLGGSITLSFSAIIPGPTPVPSSGAVSIFQAIPGWDTVSCTSGVVGNDTETRQAFEARRALSVANNALGSLPAVRGAVLLVSGVVDAFVTENDLGTTQTIGGVLLAANSLYVAAVGGTDADVAQAIWSKKAPGCAYTGNTTVTIYDTSPGYSPPYPAYSVTFERPLSLQVLFLVTIKNGPQVPANAAVLIQSAIAAAFAGQDGGPRAAIGSTIYASRFYAPIAALGAWVQIVSLLVGSGNDAAAKFTASILAANMTVSAVASGTLAVGQMVVDEAGNVLPGTTILSQTSGPAGGAGVYVVSVTQTVVSEAMAGALANVYDTTARIDQIPVVSAANVAVVLA